MPYRLTPLVNEGFYHVFNRGVEKRRIFNNSQDYQRFLRILFYYQFKGPKPSFSKYQKFKNERFRDNAKIVDIICHCLMPNHFHFLLKQNTENGVSEFISKVINGYTKYFNIKYDRVGPLLQGPFKVVRIESDEQLLHISRYIHLNPYVSELVNSLELYQYSSYPEYMGLSESSLCNKQPIMNFFKKSADYKNFIKDHEDYALQLEHLKHLLIDEH